MSKIGINGFGRIGRMLLRAAIKNNVPVAVINNPSMNTDYAAYLSKFDSTHGRFPKQICSSPPTQIEIDNQKITILNAKDPSEVCWSDHDVGYVAECTGIFTTLESAGKHIKSGAKKVIISAPSKDAPMFVVGVNLNCYDPEKMCIISNASCTTNCLAPIAKIVHENFTICEGLMSTIHATTASQKILDQLSSKDWRGGRSAICNIIPSSTGAAKAVGKVLPDLDGKLTGMAFRVPTTNVSVVDLTVRLSNPANLDCIKKKIKEASEKDFKGILAYIDYDLVSSDFNGSTYSSVFDANASMCLNENFHKLVSWYDNEYGYACRLLELIQYVMVKDGGAKKGGDPKKPDAKKPEPKKEAPKKK